MATAWGKWGLLALITCFGLSAVLGCADQYGTTMAPDNTMQKKQVIDGRKELMRNTSGHFKDLRQKAKDGQLTQIAVNAQTMAINARHIPALYPAGTLGTPEIKSRAKPEIWQDWNGFKASAKQLEDAATNLMQLTKNAGKMGVTSAQVNIAVKAIGDTCKNCHKKFRLPKKKK
jgi:cytochrome c556